MKVRQYINNYSAKLKSWFIEDWADVQAYHPFARHLYLDVAKLVCGGFIRASPKLWSKWKVGNRIYIFICLRTGCSKFRCQNHITM